VLVFVFLNEDSEDVHERSERMIFIFANFIGDTIEKLYELPVVRFSVRYPDGARYWLPGLRDLLEFSD
jgi:hypothetical protein